MITAVPLDAEGANQQHCQQLSASSAPQQLSAAPQQPSDVMHRGQIRNTPDAEGANQQHTPDADTQQLSASSVPAQLSAAPQELLRSSSTAPQHLVHISSASRKPFNMQRERRGQARQGTNALQQRV